MSIIIKRFLEKKKKNIPAESLFVKLIKEHNHEIWRSCECGNEEDLRKTFECSVCGKVIFIPSL